MKLPRGVDAVVRLIEQGGQVDEALGVLLDLIDRGSGDALGPAVQRDWPSGIRDTIRRELPELLLRQLQTSGSGS